MRIKGTKLSNRTVALFAAAILLLSSGGFMGVKAAPNIAGQNYDATIELDNIKVQLLENDIPVENGGVLLADLKDAKPGMTYTEKISVKNDNSGPKAAPEYVRLVVRKYWTKDGEAVKYTELSPDLIELELTDSWKENDDEATEEMSVYYLSNPLEVGAESLAIKSVRINRSIMDEVKITKDPEEGKPQTITYIYKYDGYTFNIEAEAQAVQTHNADEAFKSIWGVNKDDVL